MNVRDLEPGMEVAVNSVMGPIQGRITSVSRQGTLMAFVEIDGGNSKLALMVGWYASLSDLRLGVPVEPDGSPHICWPPCDCGMLWGEL